MTISNPNHLFEQADNLIVATTPPRQTNLKRAISAAYYGLFHLAVTAAADLTVGSTKRTTPRYTLVYRSADHNQMRETCEQVGKSNPPDKFKPYVPSVDFSEAIRGFADTFVAMQAKRHRADYDPSYSATRSDAEIAVRQARTAMQQFESAPTAEREAFLFLILFRPRSDRAAASDSG